MKYLDLDMLLRLTGSHMNKIKCFLGFHKWKRVGEIELELNSTTHVQHLHECEHCKKQEYKGMGTFLL
jgi:hypothetical protein